MRESHDSTRRRAGRVVRALERAYPDAGLELDFTSPLELLVATMLAAQCTDRRVNLVTPALFAKYRTAADYAGADRASLERAIHSTGFFRAKARSLAAMAARLVECHQGEVPADREALTALPGVGLKTANVVLGNAFGQPGVVVDTHVLRVSARLGLVRARTAERVHDELAALLPRARWTSASHLLTIHGRRTCAARVPLCPVCPARRLCPWAGKAEAGRRARASAR